MSSAQKRRIVIHTAFTLFYLAGMAVEPTNTISTILRVITGLSIFYVVGESLKFALKKHFTFPKSVSGGGVAFNLLLSFSYFMCVSIILSLQYSLNGINLALTMILAIAISDLAGLKLGNSTDLETDSREGNRRNLRPVVLILLFGLSLVLLFRSGFSWPSMPGWDQYALLGGSNWIFAYGGTTNIMPAGPGSFIPYPYLFQILVASIAIFIGVHPYSIFWAAPFFTIPMFGLLVYGVSYRLSKERGQSLAAALIALTICGGESFLGPHYFFPSTMSILLFLLLLIVILDFSGKGRVPMTLICSFVLLYCAFYYYTLILTFPILLFFLIGNRHHHSRPIFIFSLIGMILISELGGSILSSGQTLPLTKKLEMMRWAYPDLLWVLFLLGASVIVAKHLSGLSKEGNSLIVLAYATSLLIVYFLPPSALNRAEIVFRSFFATIASFSFLWIQHSLEFHIHDSIEPWLEIHPKRLSSVLSHIILVLSVFLLIQPYLSYANNVPHWSNISRDECLASEWIKQNSLPDSYILTDPSTGYILRGLTLRNSSTSFIVNGHTPSPARWANLSNVIYSFFGEQDPFEVHDYFDRLPTTPDLIVITTRTSDWVRSGEVNSTFCAPSEKLAPFPGIEKFSLPFFTLVKSWETVKIYKLSEAKAVLVWIDISFSEDWSWYLDGAYKDYSSTTDSGILKIEVRAESARNAWTGLTRRLPDCSGATYVKIRYRIDVPAYALEIVLWRLEQPWIIRYLKQSQEWYEETFTLTEEEASGLVKVGLVVWTDDTLTHTFEIDYILIGKIEAVP